MDIDETVARMLDELKSLPEGTRLCSGKLICKLHPLDNFDHQWFEIHEKFCDEAEKAGFFLDHSSHYLLDEGLPFNLDFVVQKKKAEKEFDLLRWHQHNDKGVLNIFEIDLIQKKVIYCDAAETSEHLCSDDEWRYIMEMINECAFCQWKDNYDCSPDTKCSRWKVELTHRGKRVKGSCGNLVFPDAWWPLRMLCDYCREIMVCEKKNKI